MSHRVRPLPRSFLAAAASVAVGAGLLIGAPLNPAQAAWMNCGEVPPHPSPTTCNIKPVKSLSGPKTHIDGADDVAFGPDGNLYVSNISNNSISVFDPHFINTAAGDVAPIKVLQGDKTKLYGPGGIAWDSHGRFYVANTRDANPKIDGHHINMYPANWLSHTGTHVNIAPSKRLNMPYTAGATVSVNIPRRIAFKGNYLYVTASYYGTVDTFPTNWIDKPASGSGEVSICPTVSMRSWYNTKGAFGVVFDKQGRMLVTGTTYSKVSVWPANWNTQISSSVSCRGGTTGKVEIDPLNVLEGTSTGLSGQAVGLALDPSGNTVVGGGGGNSVRVFDKSWIDGSGSTVNIAPIKVLAGSKTQLNGVRGMAFDSAKNIYVGNQVGDSVRVFTDPPGPTSVSPTTESIAGGTKITLKGANLWYGAKVTVDGVEAADIHWINRTTVTFRVPALPGHLGQKVDVTVTNTDAQHGTLKQALTITNLPSPYKKPLIPQKVKVTGGGKAKKTTVRWKTPKNPDGIRPADSYRLRLNLIGCSKQIIDKKVSKNVLTYTFTRSFLLKHAKCNRTLRGDILSNTIRYRVRINAINIKGSGPVASQVVSIQK